jgi:hypothetical protein
LDKNLLLSYKTIGGLFLLVKEILHRKAGAGDAVGKEKWSSGRSFEKSTHLLDCQISLGDAYKRFRVVPEGHDETGMG